MSHQRFAPTLAVAIIIALGGCSQAVKPPPTPAISTALSVATATTVLFPISVPPTAAPAPDGTWDHPFLPATDVTVGTARWRILEARTVSILVDPLYTHPLTPQGKFVVVALNVENVGLEPQTVTSLTIVDGNHRTFAASSGMLQPQGMPPTLSLETLAPNVPRQYSTIFDLPSDSYDLRVTVSDLALLGSKVSYVLLNVEQYPTLSPTSTPTSIPMPTPTSTPTPTVAVLITPTETVVSASSTPVRSDAPTETAQPVVEPAAFPTTAATPIHPRPVLVLPSFPLPMVTAHPTHRSQKPRSTH